MYGSGAMNPRTVTSYVTLTTTTTVLQTNAAYVPVLDSFIGEPVNSSDMATLQQLAASPYGSFGAELVARVQNISGQTLVVDGKPVILFVGAEYCPYCVVQRWGLVLSLMRFGNFSALTYMTSSADLTDWATFTMHGVNYSSRYVDLAAFEVYDRAGAPLDQIPSSYASDFNNYGQAFPFIDFAGQYVIRGALLPSGYTNYISGYLGPMFEGKMWAQISAAIGDPTSPLGNLVRQEANVITAAICRVSSGAPATVCQQAPIVDLTSALQ